MFRNFGVEVARMRYITHAQKRLFLKPLGCDTLSKMLVSYLSVTPVCKKTGCQTEADKLQQLFSPFRSRHSPKVSDLIGLVSGETGPHAENSYF